MTSCDAVRRAIWADDDGEPVRTHLETCDACRVEARRRAHLSSALSSLPPRLAIPPAHLEAAIVTGLRDPLSARAWRVIRHPQVTRWAPIGAAAAAAVGVVVARRMARPSLAG